jgi:hypothetical protein
MEEYQESNPCHHAEKIKKMLDDVINHAQEDLGKVDNAKARALFDVTSRLLTSLKMVYDDYETEFKKAS